MITFAKIMIRGEIQVETGLHIGASAAFSAIGATDHPVIRDPLTQLPIIPGSSLKGKMRSLLAKAKNQAVAETPSDDIEQIRRLFGDSNSEDSKTGRLIFRDSVLANSEELVGRGARTLTEVKFENAIDRRTAKANPRQIERVMRGSKFNLEIIYDLANEEELEEDFQYISDGLSLLELDYLGGNGSRGYGRIAFKNLTAEVIFGEIEKTSLEKINKILSNEKVSS